jgi:CheY-like chemotaxis protein
MFSVTVPLAPAFSVPSIEPVRTLRGQPTLLKGARLLCVDNQPEILEAMSALLLRWGCEPILASSLAEAERLLDGQPAPDAMLVDYHLNDGENGIDLMIAMRERYRKDLPGALITADHSDALRVLARREGYPLLRKPVKPASLRATLDSLLRDRAAA